MPRHSKVARPKVTRASLVAKCNFRSGSNRDKMLSALANHESLSARVLAKRLYGDPSRTAPLHMVALGVEATLKEQKTGYHIQRSRIEGVVTYGLTRQ